MERKNILMKNTQCNDCGFSGPEDEFEITFPTTREAYMECPECGSDDLIIEVNQED